MLRCVRWHLFAFGVAEQGAREFSLFGASRQQRREGLPFTSFSLDHVTVSTFLTTCLSRFRLVSPAAVGGLVSFFFFPSFPWAAGRGR